MFSLDLESRILARARARGLLKEPPTGEPDPARQLDPADIDTASLWGPRLDKLLAEGRVSAGDLGSLALELVQPSEAQGSWMDEAAAEDGEEDLLPPSLERYEQLKLIGQGATARVYKAFDLRLRRWVALKCLKARSGEHTLAEARAQAQLEHPNICRVYEVGDEGYISMQLVEGPNLAQCFRRWDAPALIRAARDLAEAVHAAHRRGLMHLDLKPGNVLVEKGTKRVLIADFGMVREEGVALSGPCPMGTPAYSSPEQLRGRLADVDRRSDVYSLGVLLYVLLTGVFPFEAPSFQGLLDAIAEQPPIPLRRRHPELSKDLDAILLKCMEKDPERRYPTAMDLALDLDRCLEGRPVQARPLGLVDRLAHQARRHPGTTTAVGAALALLLALGGAWAWRDHNLKAQTYWAQAFGQDTIRMEGILHSGRMLALHDTSRERALVRARMDAIQAEMGGARMARAPGCWALAEGHLLLGEAEAAQQQAEAALRLGYDLPQVRLALGEALLQRYREGLQDLATYRDAAFREKRRGELQRSFRDPALEQLRRARAQQGIPPRSLPEARLALAEERTQDAIGIARELQQQEPWNYEPLLEVAEAQMLSGTSARDAGRSAEAKTLFEASLASLEQPAAIAPSDERIYRLRAHIWLQGRALALEGKSEEASLQEGLRWVDTSLAADPASGDEWVEKANLYCFLGLLGQETGQDPEPYLAQADALCARLLTTEQDPALQAKLRQIQAVNAQRRAAFASSRGQPSEAYWKTSIAEARASLATGKASWVGYQTLGMGLANEASLAQSLRGEDPLGPLGEAEAQLEKAEELYPRAQGLTLCAWAYQQDAYLRLCGGEDPTPKLEAETRVLEQARAANPHDDFVFFLLADCRRLAAAWIQAQGQDSGPAFKEAFAFCEEARARSSEGPDYWHLMAISHLERAEECFSRGPEIEADLNAAEGWIHRLLTETHEAYHQREFWSRAQLLRGRLRLAQGETPLQTLRSLARTLDRESSPEAAETRATAELWEAWALLDRGLDPAVPLAKVQAELRRRAAEECEAPSFKLLACRSELLEAAAAWRAGRPWAAALQEARAQSGTVLRRWPRHPEALCLTAAEACLEASFQRSGSVPSEATSALATARRSAPGLEEVRVTGLLVERTAWTPEEQHQALAIDPMLALLHLWSHPR